jgi:hypothetical protein
MTPYVIFRLDQSTANDHVRIPTTAANPVDAVTVLQLPTPTLASIHFGSGEGIPLLSVLQVFEPVPPERDGIFVSNGAGGGGQLILLVTFKRYRKRRP